MVEATDSTVGATITSATDDTVDPVDLSTIEWAPCTDDAVSDDALECATLAVPLDHGAPDGESIDLALIRAPATDDRAGAVLLNPGGPGASGFDFAANAASTLWQYVVLRHLLKKHAPEFLAESLFKPAFQVILGSVLLAVVAFQGYAFLHNVLGGHVNEKVNLVISMGLAGGAGMAAYAVLLDKLGYPERDLLRGYANKVLRLFGLQLRA